VAWRIAAAFADYRREKYRSGLSNRFLCASPVISADDGPADQYAVISRGLERLKVPIHVIPGDHDRKPGDLPAFYQRLGVAPLPDAITVGGYRCFFLDLVSHGSEPCWSSAAKKGLSPAKARGELGW
jgi:hypothetical protein